MVVSAGEWPDISEKLVPLGGLSRGRTAGGGLGELVLVEVTIQTCMNEK